MPVRSNIPVAFAGILLATGIPAAADPTSIQAVTAVRFWSLGDATRVVVEATGDFEFRSDRVLNPDRLFFDILGTKMRLGKRGQHVIAVNDRLLKQIRVAETKPGVTRVVFDLQAPVDHQASQLTNPSRLIIELRPAGPASVPAVSETSLPDTRSTEPVISVTVPPLTEDSSKPVSRTPESVPSPFAPGSAKSKSESDAMPLRTPKPARLDARSQSLTRVLGLKIGRIVLDAGHGGHDTGTMGPDGLLEKDLVLDVAKRLGALIESRMSAEVIYTRDDDTFIPLEARAKLANDRKADLFLSIHANSSPEQNSSGIETYYLNFTTSKAALEVAARENASSQKTVYELRDLLHKIALQDKVEESRAFAGRIQQSLYLASAKSNSRTRDRGVKKAPFVVLIGASMPSVLAEIGFVSNPRDEALFKKPAYRQRIAEGLYQGLSKYASSLSQFQVAKN